MNSVALTKLHRKNPTAIRGRHIRIYRMENGVLVFSRTLFNWPKRKCREM